MLQNKVAFKPASKIEDYIRMFQAINDRRSTNKDEYKYERVCLLIVDFRRKNPRLYNSMQELKNEKLVPQNTKVNLDNLTIDDFAKDMLAIYAERFADNIFIVSKI